MLRASPVEQPAKQDAAVDGDVPFADRDLVADVRVAFVAHHAALTESGAGGERVLGFEFGHAVCSLWPKQEERAFRQLMAGRLVDEVNDTRRPFESQMHQHRRQERQEHEHRNDGVEQRQPMPCELGGKAIDRGRDTICSTARWQPDCYLLLAHRSLPAWAGFMPVPDSGRGDVAPLATAVPLR